MRTKEEKEKWNAYMKDYYAKNKDKIREYQNLRLVSGTSTKYVKEWRVRNPDSGEKQTKRDRVRSRERMLRKKYGITSDQYNEILATQGGMCAIRGCEKRPGEIGRGALHVDHDHVTNKIRGILCSNHNTALGKVNDSIDQLQAMIDYLRSQKN